jgi:hypothetical protein
MTAGFSFIQEKPVLTKGVNELAGARFKTPLLT